MPFTFTSLIRGSLLSSEDYHLGHKCFLSCYSSNSDQYVRVNKFILEMVLFPAVETSPFLFGQGFSYCSQSAFTERGKEKGSSEIEEDRCGEISDPSNSVFCISACIVTVSVQYSSVTEI